VEIINYRRTKEALITPIASELLDHLLIDYKSPDDMFGDDGLLQQLSKALVERALQGTDPPLRL
jgi:hypothetical protein